MCGYANQAKVFIAIHDNWKKINTMLTKTQRLQWWECSWSHGESKKRTFDNTSKVASLLQALKIIQFYHTYDIHIINISFLSTS